MTSTSIEFELQTEQQKVHEYKGLERNSQNFLLAFPPGAYTTMRTVGRSSVLELETHLNRIKDTMRIRGEPVPTAADLLALIQHATQTTEYPLDKELKITLLCWIESNRLRLRAHCCPMPTLELANGKVSVEIHGSPRENAHAKNSQWVRDREQQSKQLHPDTHEVLLCAPQTLEIYEGKSSNFFIVDEDGAVCCAPLDSVLVGTMLKLVVEACEELNIPMRFQFPNAATIRKWKAGFLTSTSRIVLPIDQIWSVGDAPELIALPSRQSAVLLQIQNRVFALLARHAVIPDPQPAREQLNKLTQSYERYISLDQNPETLTEMQSLFRQDPDAVELADRLLCSLTFGTAGLRAAMGAGFGRMNGLTVIQATQGLLEYLRTVYSADRLAKDGVVIGHDHRHHSDQFARLAAAVFLQSEVRVHYYQRLVHTPSVPYAVRRLQAVCGIMITASHNPKNDNGYKLYWTNACQVISPHDKHIQAAIERNQQPRVWDSTMVDSHSLVSPVPLQLEDEYYREIKQALFLSATHPPSFDSSRVKIVYTAMHGVGYPFARRLFEEIGLPPFYAVDEQIQPDPDFRTVKYPNPEEGAGALQLSIKRAESVGARVIFANDPDADRLALAEKLSDGGEWKVFTGNEMGTILGYYIFARFIRSNPSFPREKIAMLTTVVSSKFLCRLAKKEGFRFEETLTGFKWIGNRMLELSTDGYRTLFAYEEAIGFMLDEIVPDKDGIGAMAALALAVYEIYQNGLDVFGYLQQIYERYGYFASINAYYFCYSPEKTKEIFNRIRYRSNGSGSDEPAYPESIGGFRVTGIRDLTIGYDSSTADRKATLPSSKSSQMITFQVSDGVKYSATLTLRTSGTEPKIKFYSEMTGSYANRLEIQQALAALVSGMAEELLEPQRNGLIKKSI